MIIFLYEKLLFLLFLLLPMIYIMLNYKSIENTIFSKEVLRRIKTKHSGFSHKTRNMLFIATAFFMIITISRPIVIKDDVKIESAHIDVIVGFDVSKSMFIDDVYPTRFGLSKRKFDIFLENMKNARVGVIAYSSQAFLISPLSSDYNSLSYLVKNIEVKNIQNHGTSIMSALEAVNELYGSSDKKAFLIFSDGGDKDNFLKEISYAKKNNIVVYVYAVGSQKGGIIKTKKGILKNKNGNIVVIKLNEAIEELALQSGGTYEKWSLSKSDIDSLSSAIKSKFSSKIGKSSKIKDFKELFYYPLCIAILLFFMANFSIRGRK